MNTRHNITQILSFTPPYIQLEWGGKHILELDLRDFVQRFADRGDPHAQQLLADPNGLASVELTEDGTLAFPAVQISLTSTLTAPLDFNPQDLYYASYAPEMRNSLSVKLRIERVWGGLSQQELAQKAGISVRTLQEVEQGRKYPRWQTLQKLLESLGVQLTLVQVPRDMRKATTA